MSSGYSARYADVVEEATIDKYCKKEMVAFKKAIRLAGENEGVLGYSGDKFDIDSFADNVMRGEENPPKVEKAFKKLKKAFNEKTGLFLDIGYHNSEDEGDRYDEVSGAYWNVDGMYKLTPAGKKMQNEVQRKFFVHFG